MELHNIVEDLVIPRVTDIFDTIEKSGNPDKLCTCEQCRLGTACYVLNRTAPSYLVSSRGAVRTQFENIGRQQKDADITALIYEGVKRVNHNHRPPASDSSPEVEKIPLDKPVYNIPTITGRLFDGNNFAPIVGVKMELYHNGALIAMKGPNWYNPFHLVSHTEGTYSFWPVPVLAEKVGDHAAFEYTLKAETEAGGEEYEPLIHVFKIPVISELQTAAPFSLQRTFKLPDLFMFPPGEDAHSRYLDV